jgi:flavin reductase (DIM6/NTAB) family NADH-FMN oxidoreductase RutF
MSISAQAVSAKPANHAVSERPSLEALFKAGMRQLAGGVCVIATQADGTRHASTVTSVSSLSMDPPSMVVCIKRDSSIHAPLQLARKLSINLLSTGQIDVADSCTGFDGSTGEARFRSGSWIMHKSGVPVLEDTLTSIVCKVEESWVGGSHSVLLCTVKDIVEGISGQPLVYANRSYSALQPIDQGPIKQG